jgi:hypothetical protein
MRDFTEARRLSPPLRSSHAHCTVDAHDNDHSENISAAAQIAFIPSRTANAKEIGMNQFVRLAGTAMPALSTDQTASCVNRFITQRPTLTSQRTTEPSRRRCCAPCAAVGAGSAYLPHTYYNSKEC